MATIVVTGGSSGVGLAAAKKFAGRGDRVILVGRDPGRLAAATAAVRDVAGEEPTSFRADFESLSEVRDLAAAIKDATEDAAEGAPQDATEGNHRIDVLVNNAGGMVGDYRRTEDGFEASVQGNHLAPFLLTSLLRDRVDRVVNTASQAHRRAVPDPRNLTGTPGRYSSWMTYSQVKACNVLFAAEAARRWPDILSVSFHPGVVRTNFGAGRLTRFFFQRAPFLSTPEEAADRLVFLATVPRERLVNGGYYVNSRLAKPAAHARSAGLAAELWIASEEAVKE